MTDRLVASQRRAMGIFLGSVLVLGIAMIVVSVLVHSGMVPPSADLSLVAGIFVGGTIGSLFTLAVLKTERSKGEQ
ncbi:hypothetical protein HY493_00025 [Candidatus Woesearchaeota archaeon]|nr:hypothetical protein [Candidatus Woesearchaeota archaeon]